MLLLPREVALLREEELLLRCTREVLEELLERLTAAGELLRWLVCCTLRDDVGCWRGWLFRELL